MNQPKSAVADRRAPAGKRLADAARLASNATDLLDEEIARFMGINRTDARCVDLIDFHSRITAGELARAASLTTGAVTTAVDRLVRAKLVRRERGSDDRRKVYIELTDEGRAMLRALYAPFNDAWLGQGLEFSSEALATLTNYFTISRRLNLAYVAALREVALPPRASLGQRIAAAAPLAGWSLHDEAAPKRRKSAARRKSAKGR